ncbi:Uncharacterized protein Fot_25613 [Forsythia ovata]|uniref:Uncharacterized protein n=1 Tax=Forsythia ovata TaxID=205694 RepID=A0ABD1UAV9_9LAMI
MDRNMDSQSNKTPTRFLKSIHKGRPVITWNFMISHSPFLPSLYGRCCLNTFAGLAHSIHLSIWPMLSYLVPSLKLHNLVYKREKIQGNGELFLETHLRKRTRKSKINPEQFGNLMWNINLRIAREDFCIIAGEDLDTLLRSNGQKLLQYLKLETTKICQKFSITI